MSFSLHHPESVSAAVALARQFGDKARFIAGGTDLIIQINRRRVSPEHLIDLTHLRDLSDIVEDASGVTLGALATHKSIERHHAFKGPLIAVAEAARVVGGHQVRNMGTIGGNIANASPAADVVVPLLALNAELRLTGPDGERQLALGDFLLGPGNTARTADELLCRISVPALPANSATAFLKAGRRRAMEISVVCVAAGLTLDPGTGRCQGVRIAMGAVGGTTLRARAAEQALEGCQPSENMFRRAGDLASEACSPISDVRASLEYRRLLTATLVARSLKRCVSRIEEVSR